MAAEPQYLDQAFEKVLAEMLETFIKKHKDYGKDNILDTGELGIVFRVNDKVKRLQHLLMQKKRPENESFKETWIDIATYAVIAILLKQKQFEKLDLDPKK
ncbi:MAG: nucleotide modification associated domain-containing protein [Patescibacteria group bacterium]|nr:nucleotide modification associated domain-containing protein [Patescibacteria group bacterium]